MLIVATAGHIDHGKTSLVRALTGVDTDRLAQERARGISIDLGFAYWEAAPDRLVAFVDVPGHHRFIRNMLAGVAAIHFALLLVAVDDGPMPQTLEHVQILDYLGVRHGVVVLSKADAAGPQRIAQVRAQVDALLRGTTLAGIASLPVSSRTGEGIAQLQALLAREAQRHDAAARGQRGEGRRARFAIDRVFSVRGAGTVVTGTVFEGRIAREDRVKVSCTGEPLRVRGIQVHGREVPHALAGERAAINLAGVDVPDIARGDWLTHPDTAAAGKLMEVSLGLLPGGVPLRHGSPARLYLGAGETACRVLLQERVALEPGQRTRARLYLDGGTVAVNGDRFVLRDGSGSRTLGGGVVVDPVPAGRRRRLAAAEFEAAAAGDPQAALLALLAGRGHAGVELARFERMFNLDPSARDAALAACAGVVLGKAQPVVLQQGEVEAVLAQVLSALEHDRRDAVPLGELRAVAAPELQAEPFEALLRSHAARCAFGLSAGGVALDARRQTVRHADVELWMRIRPLIEQKGLEPLRVEDLAASARVAAGRLRPVLHARLRTGDVFQVRPEQYIGRGVVAQLAAAVAETAKRLPEGRFTAADYRDQIGTGRMLAINVLEMFDGLGITRRTGDQRTLVRDPQATFGDAPPYRAAAPRPGPPRTRSRPPPYR